MAGAIAAHTGQEQRKTWPINRVLQNEVGELAIIVHQSIQQGQGILGTGVLGKHLQAAHAHRGAEKAQVHRTWVCAISPSLLT